MPNIPTIPASELDFSGSPLFCKNGDADHYGQITHISSDKTIAIPGHADMPASAGGVVFLSGTDGTYTFYNEADFVAGFSRLLNDGTLVPLTEELAVQGLKTRNDPAHFGDLRHWVEKKGVRHAKAIYAKALKSDAGLAASEQLDDLKEDMRDFKIEVTESAKEIMGDVSQAMDALTASKVGQKARSALANARRFWGAATNKS